MIDWEVGNLSVEHPHSEAKDNISYVAPYAWILSQTI